MAWKPDSGYMSWTSFLDPPCSAQHPEYHSSTMIAFATIVSAFVALLPLGAMTARTPIHPRRHSPELARRQNDTSSNGTTSPSAVSNSTAYYPCGDGQPTGIISPEWDYLMMPVPNQPFPSFQFLYCAPRFYDDHGVVQETPSINATIWLRGGQPSGHTPEGQVLALGLVPNPSLAAPGSGYYGYITTIQLPEMDNGALYGQPYTLTIDDLVQGKCLHAV